MTICTHTIKFYTNTDVKMLYLIAHCTDISLDIFLLIVIKKNRAKEDLRK